MKSVELPYRLVAVADLEAAEDERRRLARLAVENAKKGRDAIDELKRYKQALEFYADRKNYRPRGLLPKVAVTDDYGKHARDALRRFDE
jgi:hypothetical protein